MKCASYYEVYVEDIRLHPLSHPTKDTLRLLVEQDNLEAQNQKPKKSVVLPSIGAGVSGLILAGEGITAVLLFGLKNNALQTTFNFAKSALTLPGFGILAGVVAIGSGVDFIFFTKKAISNSRHNKLLTENSKSKEQPKDM